MKKILLSAAMIMLTSLAAQAQAIAFGSVDIYNHSTVDLDLLGFDFMDQSCTYVGPSTAPQQIAAGGSWQITNGIFPFTSGQPYAGWRFSFADVSGTHHLELSRGQMCGFPSRNNINFINGASYFFTSGGNLEIHLY